MAKKEAPATVDERVFTVPLRASWIGSTRVARTRKSVGAVRSFVTRHMRSENIKISRKLNSVLWGSGAKTPLSRIRVKATMDSSGLVSVRLPEEVTLEEEKKQFLEKAKKEEEEKKSGKPEERNEEAKAGKTEGKTEGKPAEEEKAGKDEEKKKRMTKF
jgi:large subunit ribosomal protein L31e